MQTTRELTKGQAVLLGGLAAGAVLCFCLTLVAFAFLFVALIFLDRDNEGGSDWTVPAIFLSVTLSASGFAAFRFGCKVGKDWYRKVC